MQFLKNKKYFNKTTYSIIGVLIFFGVFAFVVFNLLDKVIPVPAYDDHRSTLYQDYTVQKEKDRIDVLILGIRAVSYTHLTLPTTPYV